jgi:hypothetical protein
MGGSQRRVGACADPTVGGYLVDGELSVSPQDLFAAGGQLGDVSSQVKQVLSAWQAKLAGYGQSWGDDAIGNSSANGPSGYLAQRDWIVGALGNDSSLLDGYSASIIIGSAKNFEQQDNS